MTISTIKKNVPKINDTLLIKNKCVRKVHNALLGI